MCNGNTAATLWSTVTKSELAPRCSFLSYAVTTTPNLTYKQKFNFGCLSLAKYCVK